MQCTACSPVNIADCRFSLSVSLSVPFVFMPGTTSMSKAITRLRLIILITRSEWKCRHVIVKYWLTYRMMY